jgi:hypothetical protein
VQNGHAPAASADVRKAIPELSQVAQSIAKGTQRDVQFIAVTIDPGRTFFLPLKNRTPRFSCH